MPAMLDAPCAPCSRVGCVLRTTPSTGGILGSRPGGPWQAAKGPNGHRQPFPLFAVIFSTRAGLPPLSPATFLWWHRRLACAFPALVGRASVPASFRPRYKFCKIAGVTLMGKNSSGPGFQPGRCGVVSPGRTCVSARLFGLFRNKSDSLPFLCGN